MTDGASSLAIADAAAVAARDPQLEALGELVGIGLKLARAVGRRVDDTDAGAGPLSVADLNGVAIAYARVARAVRQTVMLQEKLQTERTAVAAKAGDLRARVARIVRRVIEDEDYDGEQVERLQAEAVERLEQERYGDVLIRPVGEIVAAICSDLGLKPDWDDLFDEVSDAEAFARGEAILERPPGPLVVRWLDDSDKPPLGDSS